MARAEGAATRALARGPRGLPEAGATRLVPLDGALVLVVADVPTDAFGDEVAAARVDDVAWLAERALRHEAVVEHVAERAAAVPMKLFTVFSSDGAAAAQLAASRRGLERALDRIDGAAEWGVRVVSSARPPDRAKERATALRASSGAAFLAARRDSLHSRESSRRDAAASARAAFDGLVTLARDRVILDRRAPSPLPVWLDAVLLVPRAKDAAFARAVARARAALEADGLALELTGPWPCYHFVTEAPADGARA